MGGTVASMALSGPNDGWAVGSSWPWGLALRLSGGAWQVVSLPASTQALFALALSGPNDGWAMGRQGQILRLNGGTWSTAPSPTSETFAGRGTERVE